jgi:hypothetical protein
MRSGAWELAFARRWGGWREGRKVVKVTLPNELVERAWPLVWQARIRRDRDVVQVL